MTEDRKQIVKGDIGNALHSVAPDHITTTADEIFDEERQQYQQDINEGVGNYEEDPDFIALKLDKNKRILEATRRDGTKFFGGAVESGSFVVSSVDNPEFVAVWTIEDKILFGVQKDGNFLFGCGIPKQVEEYIRDVVFGGKDVTEIIDTLNEITTFLDGFVSGSNLKQYLDETYGYEEENPEFMRVIRDSVGHILFGIYAQTGKPYFPQNELYHVVSNPEWLAAWISSDNKILFGFKRDGNSYVGDKNFTAIVEQIYAVGLDSIDWSSLGCFTETSNPEWLSMEFDERGKILSGRRRSGGRKVEHAGIETPEISVGGNESFSVNDPENRLSINRDSTGKIISFRKNDGTLVENAGIETPEISLSKRGLDKLASELDIPLPETIGLYKSPNLPKYGTTNIKTEIFYLTAIPGLNSLSQTALIQDFEDSRENANARMTIYHYYFGNIRLRHYAAAKVKLDKTDNKYYAKETIKKIGNLWYYADTLYQGVGAVIEGYSEIYSGSDIPESGDWGMVQTEVLQFTGPCCIGAWNVEAYDEPIEGTDIGKKYEHHCICDINFGHYLTKTDAYIGVKHQGNSSMGWRKRGLRYTFYKKSDYNKKDKVKFGEMLRLSKFNLKSNWTDMSRIKELILYRIFTAVWQNRPITDRYNWDNRINGLYHGVTGNIQGFPIQLSVNGEFYGIYCFNLPKDGKNYFIDDEDESTGLFVSGAHNTANDWGIAYPYRISSHYDSEMDSSDFADYPMIDMALGAWTGFINNRMYRAEDGKGYDLFQCTFRGADNNHYNYSQVTYNEETGKWYHDDVEILSIYVTDMYWDSEHNTYHRSETTEINDVRYVTSTLDPETGQPTQDSIIVSHFNLTDALIEFDRENIPERLDVLGFMDYFICMQVFMCYDNQHNNVLLYSDGEKKKMFPFFYDLDLAIYEGAGTNADILEEGVSLSQDVSFWKNFKDEYWDEIVNRYCELRKTYLSLDYIKNVYVDIADNIPVADYNRENERWGVNADSSRFDEKVNFITERLQWLDESYFNI